MPTRPVHATLATVASLLLVAAGCSQDGPPVATRASNLEPTEHAEVAELAEQVTVEADEEEPSAPAPEAFDDPDGDVAGEETFAGEGAAGAGIGSSADPPPMPGTVAVIGDSIARSADPYLRPGLEALGLDIVAYDAVESRRMVNGGGAVPPGTAAIDGVVTAGGSPDLWIVALGTNDVGAATGREAWVAAIDEVMDAIPSGADVIWVDTWLAGLDPAAVEFNATLRDELRRHRDTLVLDWHGRAATDGLIIADGVHLSDAGRIEYARLVTDAIRATYDRRVPGSAPP